MGLGRVPAGGVFYAQVLPTCDCGPTRTALGSTPLHDQHDAGRENSLA